MANRYEVVEEGSNRVLVPACGNVGVDNWSDQRGSRDYSTVREVRHARQDADFNWVHVTYVKERY